MEVYHGASIRSVSETTATTERAATRSLDAAWAIIAVGLPIVATLLQRTEALDLAYHLRVGGAILDTGAIPRVDDMTYTVAGVPWLDQQWAAQAAMALLYRVGSWPLLDAFRAVGVGVVTGFVYLACRGRGAIPRTATLLAVGGWFVAIETSSMLRPQLFGATAFAVSLWAIATRRSHPGRIWILPAVMLVWANVHGSFPLVLALLVIAALEDRRDRASLRRLAIAAAGCLVASMITPYGPRVWSYVADLSGNTVIRERVSEWQATSVDASSGIAFFVSLLVVLVLLARRRRAVEWPTLLGVVVFAGIGAAAFRGIVWWSMAAPVLVAAALADPPEVTAHEPAATPSRRDPFVAVVGVALAALILVAFVRARGTDPVSGAPVMLAAAPERLVAAAREAVPADANVFVSQLYSSWVEFSAPGWRVPADARIELYPDAVWEDYFTVSAGDDGWDQILDRDDVQALILAPDQAEGLLEVLASDDRWRSIIRTDEGEVFVRT